MKKVSTALAAATAFLLTGTSALASSFATPPFQVNVIPLSFYVFVHAVGEDPGNGKFAVMWDEDWLLDQDGDGFNDGMQVRTRMLQIVGGKIVQYKPTVRVDNPATVGEKVAIGFFKTNTGALRAVWSEIIAGKDTVYWQSFVGGVKSGGRVALTAARSGRQANVTVTGRSDGVGAVLSTPLVPFGNFKGRLVTAAGQLGTAVSFAVTGGWVIGFEGVGTAFTALASKYDATYANWQHQGRSFSGTFVAGATATNLMPLTSLTRLPIVGFTGRNDGKAVFFKVLRNSSGKYDLYGQVYTAKWTAPTAQVKIVADTLDPAGGYLTVSRLAGGDLMIGYQKVEAAGQHSIVLQRLNASLAKVGTPVKIGPAAGQTWYSTFPITGGKVIVTYNLGNALYARAVTP